jgi:hypothetical protein
MDVTIDEAAHEALCCATEYKPHWIVAYLDQ